MDMDARIAALDAEFGVPGVAKIVRGNGDLPKIQIDMPAASGGIYLHGAQVTSWRPKGAEEVLFVSTKSNWSDGKAIRGGIPVCFPWFRAKADDPQAPAHGFVRTREWQIESIAEEEEGAAAVLLSTQSDDSTKRWWPVDFSLEYRITIGRELELELTVKNRGSSGIQFEEALHTYFNVGEVEEADVSGLDGVTYLDNRDENRRKIQLGAVRLKEQSDRAYVAATGEVIIADRVKGRVLKTVKQHSSSTIVWNPWRDGAARLADLGDDEWRRMLCVEGGNILDSAVRLEAGGTHRMLVKISAAND
jgi:glucose-6-phosphate 1-epimerase